MLSNRKPLLSESDYVDPRMRKQNTDTLVPSLRIDYQIPTKPIT